MATEREVEGWKVLADRNVCIGSGMCVVYAPNTFTQDDEAKVALLDPCNDAIDVVRTAVDACPTGALRLIDAGGRADAGA